MTFCGQCGNPIEDNDRFCGSCGSPVVSPLPDSEDLAPTASDALTDTDLEAAVAEPIADPVEVPRAAAADLTPAPEAEGLGWALSDSAAGCAALGVRFDHQFWFVPESDEQVVGRWMCTMLKGFVAIGDDGSELSEVPDGAGMLVLTSRRIVVTVLQGPKYAWPPAPGSSHIAVLSLPLASVRDVTLMRSDRGKPRGVMIGARRGDLVVADLDRFVTETRRSQRSDKAESMRMFVHAVADAVQPFVATPAHADFREGSWTEEDGDLVARVPQFTIGAQSVALADPVGHEEGSEAEPIVEASHATETGTDVDPQGKPEARVSAAGPEPQDTPGTTDSDAGQAPSEPPEPVAPSEAVKPQNPAEGWYLDPERPGRWRWWDGKEWGIRDDQHDSTPGAAESS